MKIIYLSGVLASVIMAVLIALPYVITKYPTPLEIKQLEEYKRQDLSSDDAHSYETSKEWILRNDNSATDWIIHLRVLGWTTCGFLFAVSFAGLVRTEQKAQQAAPGNRRERGQI
jgi:hypothetical protein